MEILIEVSHLVKRYGSTAAVDDLSFTVEKGQIYGFLGPNGAGKSTTMNILTGYIAPTSGEVLINGHNILEEPEEARKCIGYLPEIPPVYPEMTVEEYLTFAAGLKKIAKAERSKMIEEAMELTGVSEMRHRLIRNLSKGYRQRTGLAQAILGYPEIIILDEPMVGLDPKQIIEIRELIRNLSKRHTVILSSHILSEISAICDHIMIIAHGQLVASDTPENLIGLMKSSGALELTVKGSESSVRMLAEAMHGTTSVEVTASPEKGAWDMTIRTAGDTDLREQLFCQCAERKLPILRMQQTHVSLEDVFLELTGEGNASGEGEPEEERTHGTARGRLRGFGARRAAGRENDSGPETDSDRRFGNGDVKNDGNERESSEADNPADSAEKGGTAS